MSLLKCYELTPQGRQKSFYGKAEVVYDDGELSLISYTTAVAKTEPIDLYKRVNLKGWYSRTTARHLDSFLSLLQSEYGFYGLNTAIAKIQENEKIKSGKAFFEKIEWVDVTHWTYKVRGDQYSKGI